jgi:hypothetical protein
MKFRLDAQHYINDRLLEPGHIIGDETDMPMVLPNGEPIKPSVNMTPLDDEAWSLFRDTFPGVRRPERDPTKAIPLRGTGDSAKAPPLYTKDSDGRVIQPGGGGAVQTVDNVPGGYVVGPDGEPTKELKKGLPDPGSPNHPVGQPVIGSPSASPAVPPKPEDPAFRVAVPPAEQKAVADAQAKAQAEAAGGSDQQKAEQAAKAEAAAKAERERQNTLAAQAAKPGEKK